MYSSNYLASRLRAASVGRNDALFAELPDGSRVSYGAMFEAAERNAAALVAAGVQPGDRVAVQVDKSLEALQLYLGTVLAGGVFLPLNTAYTPAEVEYFLTDAEPAVFVCRPQKLDELTPVVDKAGAKIFSLSDVCNGTWMAEVAGQQAGFTAVARAQDDLAAILYTSGTTGRSKGAMLSHGNLASNAETLSDHWRFSKEDVLIHALPIFHTHGLFVATNVTLVTGSSVIFMPKFDGDQVIAAMDRASCMMGVPTFYTRLLDHPGLTRETTSKMRLFVSGSAPLLAETFNKWVEVTGHRILERYGMTETNMNTSNPYDGDRRAGTVGFPLPGVEVKVTDPETGVVLPQGEVGALEVRGPNVFQGYWRMPEKTKEELRDNGFFLTGDLGVIDERGYVSIVGRSKDLIISGGYNVYPKEVESLIDEIPGVVESAVIGLPHPDFGEGVAAVIVREAGAEIGDADIADNLKSQLAKYKQPKKMFFVDQLPRNTMGKVQKKLLRETYADSFA